MASTLLPEKYWTVSFEPEHICPAQPGWRAVFRTDEGGYVVRPVVCWATGWRINQKRLRVFREGKFLYSENEGEPERERDAFGLVVDDGYLGCPQEDSTFCGYAGPGEPLA